MKTLKHSLLVLALCLTGVSQVWAQLGWARSFDINNTSIPIPGGATWVDVAQVLRVNQNRYVVAGTIQENVGGRQSTIVARFAPDGSPGWVVRLHSGAPSDKIVVADIVESPDPNNPGYALCGRYTESTGSTFNYLARIDELGNLQWDYKWQSSSSLRALIFNRNNHIVTVGATLTRFGVYNTSVYRFSNAGALLASRLISTDPEIMPVDLIEDPLYNSTGGYFILASYRDPYASTATASPAVIFFNYPLTLGQLQFLPYPFPAYQFMAPVCFKQDPVSRAFYILCNGLTPSDTRPTVMRFVPFSLSGVPAVVLTPATIPTTNQLTGTDLELNPSGNDMLITTQEYISTNNTRKTHTWNLSYGLVTNDVNEQTLILPGVRNMSLCKTPDNIHYLLAGHDGGNNLTLNVVDLDGRKVKNSGAITCTKLQDKTTVSLTIPPSTNSFGIDNLTFSPASPTVAFPFNWSYADACDCAEVPAQTYFRYAYPKINYDLWELDINRASMSSDGMIYMTNTRDLAIPGDYTFVLELNSNGQHVNSFEDRGGNIIGGIPDQDGRQTLKTLNGGTVVAKRVQFGPKQVLAIEHRGATLWGYHFPSAQSPGRVYMGEATNNGNIIIVGDIDGLDQASNTHDLFIACFNSAGTIQYYREIPITYGGSPRDNFRVHAVEVWRDGSFALCGSSGTQNNDFIAGHVMKFSSTGTLNWQYVFRKQTTNSCYDLTAPQDCHSVSVFYDLRRDVRGGYYVAGYTSDHDQMGVGASYWNGLLVQLDASGNEITATEYAENNGSYTTFKGIRLNGNDIAVVGEITSMSTGATTELFERIDKTTLAVLSAQTYSIDGASSLHDVFVAPGGTGYLMTGHTTSWHGVHTPLMISTDVDGVNGCEVSLNISALRPTNDPVGLTLGTPVNHGNVTYLSEKWPTCVEVFDVCKGVTPAISKPVFSGVNDFNQLAKNEQIKQMSVYPNPASNSLNVQVPSGINLRSVVVLDMNGREVYNSKKAVDIAKGIDISMLPEGVYAVRVETNKGAHLMKFIKQ